MSDLQNLDVISAAFDGERVDLAALRAALAADAGRAALASFLLVRAAMRADDAEPAPTIPAQGGDRARWMSRRWRVAAGVAAATLMMAFGFWAGGTWKGRGSVTPRPATQVVAPADGAPGAGAAAPGVAPRPTRVLRFTPGVDWHNRS